MGKSKITVDQLNEEIRKNDYKLTGELYKRIAKKYNIPSAHGVACKVSTLRKEGLLIEKEGDNKVTEQEEREGIEKILAIMEEPRKAPVFKAATKKKPVPKGVIKEEVVPEIKVEEEVKPVEKMKEYFEPIIERTEKIKPVSNMGKEAIKDTPIAVKAEDKARIEPILKIKSMVMTGKVFDFEINKEGVKIVGGLVETIDKQCIKEQMMALKVWEEEFKNEQSENRQ